MTSIRRWLFRVQFSYSNALDALRARSLQVICVILGGLSLIAVVGLLAYGLLTPGDVLLLSVIFNLIIVGVTSLLVIAFIQRGHLYTGAALLIIVVALNVVVLQIPDGIRTASIINFSFPLILAAVLFNRRGIAVVLIALIAALVLVDGIASSGLLPIIAQSPMRNLNQPTLQIVIVLLADAGVLWVFLGAQNELQQINRAGRDLRAATSISQVMNNQFGVDELLVQTVESIHEQFGYYHVQIFLVEETSRLVVRRARTGSGADLVNDERRIALDDPQNSVVDVVRTGQIGRVESAAPRSRRTEFLPATQSEILIPLQRGAQTLGVLDVQSIVPDPFPADDVTALETVAAQVAIALQNIQRAIELQRERTDHQHYQDEAQRLGREVQRLESEAIGRTWSRYLQGRAEEVLGFDWQNGTLTPNTALTASMSHAFDNAMPAAIADDHNQILSVPIVSRGRTLGIMEFRAAGDAPWSSRSIELARIIAQRLSLSLDNIRLFEQAQETANREQMISRVAARLQTKTDLEALLNEAQEAFSQALGTSRVQIQMKLPDLPISTEQKS